MDSDDIKKLVQEFNYERAKIVLNGQEIFDRDDIDFPEALSEELKEEWFGAKYKVYAKPNLEDISTESDEVDMHAPAKNRFVPVRMTTQVPQESK